MSEGALLSTDPAIRFHEIHGTGIQLLNNNTTARLPPSPSPNILFSSHPIQPYQIFSIKFSDVSDKVTEIISVGFTPDHPSNNQGDIPSVKIMTGRKQYHIKNKILFFYFTPSGTIYFGVDNEKKGEHQGKIKTRDPLWAFMKIHNTPTTVEVINFQGCDWSVLSLTPMMLHPSRGRNIKLLQNTACKFDKRLSVSYAFSSRPIGVNEHVVVKILDTDSRYKGGLSLGLTTCDPMQLQQDDLPDKIETFLTRDDFWTIITDSSWSFKQYDKISFVIDPTGEMKIWRNDSTLLKTVRVAQISKIWVFFDIVALAGIAVTSYKSLEFDEFGESSRDSEAIINETKNTNIISDKKDESECVVCCEGAVEAALYPCGHMCMCYDCAREQWRGAGHGKCPMCRVAIRDVLKIYKK